MHTITILLGTNLGNKKRNLKDAAIYIESSIGSICQRSSMYESVPWGFQSNNNFLNQAIQVKSQLKPNEILKACKSIEQKMGREITDSMVYTDRIIDIDILFYDDLVLNTLELTIPHPKLHERSFVLIALCEIMPEFTHPLLNKSIDNLLKENRDTSNRHPR